ncbi:MAG: hypothetical protein WD534_14215 [Phycisphaeraceae bacterium]
MGQASRRKRERREARQEGRAEPHRPTSSPAKKLIQLTLALVVVGLLGTTVWVTSREGRTSPSDQRATPATIQATALHTDFEVEPETLNELLDLPTSALAKVDIARMNLLCATDLPGAENLDIDHALATLDEWAERVATETDRHLYRVTDPRYAAHYRHSEAYFRAEFLLQVLQQDLGVKYDMTAADNFAFDDSRVAFLHGMIPAPGQTISDTAGGTCASMPVMYVAIGRRLGYPLKLVTTNSHIFVRWDGEDHPDPAWREQFNIEGAGEGFASFEDDYYTTWPFSVTDHEVRVNRYLIPLTPMEEFAAFLAARGHVGEDNGQFAFAARSYENAYRYDPSRPAHRAWFMQAAARTDYRPITPVLASALQQRRDHVAAVRHPSIEAGIAGPSAVAMYEPPEMAHTSRIGPWRGQVGGARTDLQRRQLPQHSQRQWSRPVQPDHSTTPQPFQPQVDHSPDWGTP